MTLKKSLRVQDLNQINTWQQPQGPLPAFIFFLLPLSTFLCFFQHQRPLYCCPAAAPVSSAADGEQFCDRWGTSGEHNQEQVRQWNLSWGCAVPAGPGEHRRCRYRWGVGICVVALAVGQQCAQAGKGTVLHRKVCTGHCALHGAAGREHCGMIFCVEKLWRKHFKDAGCLWGACECASS